jgi:hypothetical protein
LQLTTVVFGLKEFQRLRELIWFMGEFMNKSNFFIGLGISVIHGYVIGTKLEHEYFFFNIVNKGTIKIAMFGCKLVGIKHK